MQVKNILSPKITTNSENVPRAVFYLNIEEELEQKVEYFDELMVPRNIKCEPWVKDPSSFKVLLQD